MRIRFWLCAVAVLAGSLVTASCQKGTGEAQYMARGKQRLADKDYARAILEFKNAAKVAPKDSEPPYQAALAYIATGNMPNAVGALRQAIALNPKHTDAQLKLAELMTTSRNKETVQQAKQLAETVLVNSPENPDALQALAMTEVRLGDSTAALAHLEQALQKAPHNLDAAGAAARLKLQAKDRLGAEKILKTMASGPAPSAHAYVTLGRFYLVIDRVADAETQFRRALEIDPKNGMALLDLGSVQMHNGQTEQAGETFKQVSALPEAAYRSVYALFLFDQGKRDAAIQEFESVLKRAPDDRDVRTRLVRAYLVTNQKQKAFDVIAAALKRNPKNTNALFDRSELYLLVGKTEEARNDLREVLRVQPDSASAHYRLARVLNVQGAEQAKRQELTEALRLDPNLTEARVMLAKSLVANQAASTALEVLDQAPAAQRNLLPIRIERNWALLGVRDLSAARRGIDETLKMQRGPEVLLQDSFLRYQQKDYAGTRATSSEVLRLDPENLLALDQLALSYQAQGDTAKAVQALREYAAKRPRSAGVQYFLGRWLEKTNARAEARKAYDTAKVANPNYLPAGLALARLDIQDGKYDLAQKSLNAILQADSRNAEARMLLAAAAERMGNYGEAINEYRKLVEADPHNGAALNNLAYRLANNANQPDEAIRVAQQAKELAPDSPEVDDTIGWAYYQKGLYRTAQGYLEASALKRPSVAPKYHLAMTYFKLGEVGRANETLQAALKLDPNAPEAKLALDLLERGRAFPGR